MPNLFNPAVLKSLCARYGLRPNKHYGQNFLIDPAVIDTIIAAAELSPADTVVEVGPGFGTLTLPLAERAKQVMAFEIEKKLQPYWEKVIKEQGAHSTSPLGKARDKSGQARNKKQNIGVVWGNALKQVKSQKSLKSIKSYQVVANLPYQITSAVIRLFLEAERPPQLMVLMVQKEVAERICALPPKMSLLSVAVQYYAKPEIISVVPRAAFWPAPAVDSAILKIKIQKSKIKNLEFDNNFFRIVRAGFSHPRKLLANNLAAAFSQRRDRAKRRLLAAAGVAERARAQELSVEQWQVLAVFLADQ